MGKLDGKVALITGSGRNIGKAMAIKFAEEGADVVVNARQNKKEVEEVANEVRERGRKSLAVLADVSSKVQVDAMVEQALREFGRIDVLVSNASIRPSKPFHEITLEDWEAVRGVDLDGAVFLARAALPSMLERGGGTIIFMLGDAVFLAGGTRTHTSAAKMGIVGLARGLASEYVKQNIRVNVLSPLSINTNRAGASYTGAQRLTVPAANIPMGRLGHVDEVVSAALFLASDECAFMTGQTIHVNGGAGFF
jgi:3-oxoacyl-[acyl-carrier protein] reductase